MTKKIYDLHLVLHVLHSSMIIAGLDNFLSETDDLL